VTVSRIVIETPDSSRENWQLDSGADFRAP